MVIRPFDDRTAHIVLDLCLTAIRKGDFSTSKFWGLRKDVGVVIGPFDSPSMSSYKLPIDIFGLTSPVFE